MPVQIAHPQAIELQKVLAQQRAAVIQVYQAQLAFVRFDFDFEQRRPTPQHRATQAQQQPLPVNRQPFDVKTVVFAGYRHERPEVRVIGQQAGQLVGLRIAFQPQGASAVLCPFHQAGLAIGIGLDGQAGQQAAVGIQRQLGQPLGIGRVIPFGCGVFALEAVLAVPLSLSLEVLQNRLETLADDLMVELRLRTEA